jgi:hypothetical protein
VTTTDRTNEYVEELSEDSPELLDALGSTLAQLFNQSEPLLVDSLHTGGGVYVAVVDLSLDARFMGRQLWLTREDETTWLLGFYDFAENVEDEGVCVAISCPRLIPPNYDRSSADSPWYIASQVAAILSRLGVDTLQGA